MNSCLELGEPIASRGLEGSPDGLERIGGMVNGSGLSSDIYAGGPSTGSKNFPESIVSSIAGSSSGRDFGESDRRLSGNEHIRHAEVRIKMLYVR